jgi:hypothetical protein
MKRLRVTAVFLLSGTVLNVAVAWGCAFYCRDFPVFEGYTHRVDDENRWTLFVRRGPGMGRCTLAIASFPASAIGQLVDLDSDEMQRQIPSWATACRRAYQDGRGASSIALTEVEAAGWPMLSFVMTLNSPRGTSGGWAFRPTNEQMQAALTGPHDDRLFWGMPYRPQILATIVNSSIYAGLLWLIVVLAPACLRQSTERRRRAQGQCGQCGYDMTSNTTGVCPECGHTR